MPGQYQAVKPRIYTTRRGLDTVKRQSRPATMYDAPPPPSTDTTIAALTPGEYVLPRWLVDDIQAGQPPHPGPTPPHMRQGGEAGRCLGISLAGQYVIRLIASQQSPIPKECPGKRPGNHRVLLPREDRERQQVRHL